MQPAAPSETDPTPQLAPPIRHVVPWRVRSVDVLSDMRVRVTFVDGTEGEVSLKSLLSDPQIAGTVFEPLRDPEFFAQVRVAMGALQWPNGADLAPDAMYDAIKEHGSWVPS